MYGNDDYEDNSNEVFQKKAAPDPIRNYMKSLLRSKRHPAMSEHVHKRFAPTEKHLHKEQRSEPRLHQRSTAFHDWY